MKNIFTLNKIIVVSILIITKGYYCFGENFYNTFDDWLVTTSCQDRTSKLCHGYYLEPVYPYPLDEQTDYPTKITSNHGEFINKKSAKFFGEVLIQQGNQNLTCNKAIVNHNAQTGEIETMQAFGNVKLTQPGMRIDGSKAIYYKPINRKIIYQATYRMYQRHARGTADSITLEQQTNMELPNASYTTCAPQNNSWQLKAKKLKLNKATGRGTAWHSWLYLKKMKVFYWPYINFPIDNNRHTGFLMPSFHSSSSHGAHLAAPFYWDLAPNYDALITPHFMQNRGIKLDNHFRYLTKYSSGNIKFNFLPNDRGYQRFRHKQLENPGNINPLSSQYLSLRNLHNRWSLVFNDQTTFNKNFRTAINYTRVGDDNYIYDFDGDIMQQAYPVTNNALTQANAYLPAYSATTSLLQKIELQNLTQLGTTTFRLMQYQILHPFYGPNQDEVYRKLPEIDVQSTTFYLPYDFDWRFSGNYTQFKLRNTPFATPLATGTRYHFEPQLTRPFQQPGWFLKPKLQVDLTNYNAMKLTAAEQANNKLTTATRVTPIYNIDSGLIFERPITIAHNAINQTLEPRMYYVYIPKRNQNLLPIFDSAPLTFSYEQIFRTNRYSGFDRIGEANQLGLGVMSKFLTKPHHTEKASFGIGRILYLRPRIGHFPQEPSIATKRWSPVAAVAKYFINPYWNLEGNLVQEKLKRTNNASLTIQYLTDPTHVINLGYQFTRNDTLLSQINRPSHLHTIQLSSAWEIKPELRLLGHTAYDINAHRITNVLLGLEHHTCCTIYRLAWLRTLKSTANFANKQYENTITLQLVLKGLSQTGNIDSSKINSMIPGYNPKDHLF